MSREKIIMIFILTLIVLAGGWYFYSRPDNAQSELEKLKSEYPELASYVDEVIELKNKLKEENKVESYVALGLALKSLADWAKNAGVENYKDYYQQALRVYEEGILITNRKNTLFMENAGNMAKYLENYELAEDYYKEAISVSPGDDNYYILLAELYEYRMNKTKEEVAAVYDEGMSRVINPGYLEKLKESYLERAGNN